MPGGIEAAPVDELTKMPLPVLPPSKATLRSTETNWHHHYHPSSSKLLTKTAGLAVRHARLQLLPVKSHHNRYHQIFEGPEYLPTSSEERFGQIILACAGYIPYQAIDVRKDDPTEPVLLTKRMRQRLQTSGEVEVRGHTNIGSFIKDHLVRQDFSQVEDSIIEEFLTTRQVERRKEIGHWLLDIASEIAVEPIRPIYSRALEEGLIIPDSGLPSLDKDHVLKSRKTSQRAVRALHRKLSKSYLQTGVDGVQLGY